LEDVIGALFEVSEMRELGRSFDNVYLAKFPCPVIHILKYMAMNCFEMIEVK